MADRRSTLCLLGIMDQLWLYDQIILTPKNLQHSSMGMASAEEQLSNNSSSHSSGTQIISEENSSSIVSIQEEDECYSNEEQVSDDNEQKGEETPKRLNLSGSETRSHSFSSTPSRKQRSDIYPGGPRRRRLRLSKTMSCKSFCELELEEVKGFMDLGFSFNKEQLDKRMMSVIPGLQRLELGNPRNNSDHQKEDGEVEEEESEWGGVIRPYLSEAWFVKRPDSALMNLRIPRVSKAEDMKKHLKYWAKTVATSVQLETHF